MSKLFKLKKWLTLDEAANYLSGTLSEPVSKSDILMLALDGHLTLSVYVVGGILAKIGRAIPRENAKKVPGIPIKGMPDYEVVLGVEINQHEVLEFDEPVRSVDGVFDLPMVYGERASCLALYRQLTNGPDVELSSIDGTFLYCPERKKYFYLHEEYLPPKKPHDTRNRWERRADVVQFPVGSLPRDSVFVVRVDSIVKFLDSLNNSNDDSKPLNSRERAGFLNIIGGLLELVLGVNENGRHRSEYRKQEAIIADLVAMRGDKDGISKSNLELKFAAANRNLKS